MFESSHEPIFGDGIDRIALDLRPILGTIASLAFLLLVNLFGHVPRLTVRKVVHIDASLVMIVVDPTFELTLELAVLRFMALEVARDVNFACFALSH